MRKAVSLTVVRSALVLGCAVLARAGFASTVVNDTWKDGTRTDPAAPVYSENGVDADADGDIESAWYGGGAGTFDPVGPGGPLRADLGAGGTSSASWTTYFTPEATPITLNSAGDSMTVTWVFTPSTVNASNTSQNFRLAVVDTSSAVRLTAEGTSGDDAYPGYGMFMNMGQTLGNSNPFQLRKRAVTGNLLSSSGNWTGLANGAASGNHGYDDNTQYTYEMTITRNASDGLDIVSTMTGGTLNGTGLATVSFTDDTPASFTFDTFSVRPSSATGTAQIFDTSLFKVDATLVPEPASVAMLSLGALGLLRRRRR